MIQTGPFPASRKKPRPDGPGLAVFNDAANAYQKKRL